MKTGMPGVAQRAKANDMKMPSFALSFEVILLNEVFCYGAQPSLQFSLSIFHPVMTVPTETLRAKIKINLVQPTFFL
jgi:hypothetical protein